jgi:hypothetical protein
MILVGKQGDTKSAAEHFPDDGRLVSEDESSLQEVGLDVWPESIEKLNDGTLHAI